MVKQRENGRVIGTELRVIYGVEKEVETRAKRGLVMLDPLYIFP